SDGRIMLVGSFTHVNGAARTFVARLEIDGSLDGTFPDLVVEHADPGGVAPGVVFDTAVQTDGLILIAGRFDTVAGPPHVGIARLNGDGSLDAAFQDPGITSFDPAYTAVERVALQTDGTVLIGGYFGSVGGVNHRNLARLHADGTLDGVFLNGMAGPN